MFHVHHSSLAEYVIGACMYFAKQFKQLDENKQMKKWERFPVAELRGKTMGVIGCGGEYIRAHIRAIVSDMV